MDWNEFCVLYKSDHYKIGQHKFFLHIKEVAWRDSSRWPLLSLISLRDQQLQTTLIKNWLEFQVFGQTQTIELVVVWKTEPISWASVLFVCVQKTKLWFVDSCRMTSTRALTLVRRTFQLVLTSFVLRKIVVCVSMLGSGLVVVCLLTSLVLFQSQDVWTRPPCVQNIFCQFSWDRCKVSTVTWPVLLDPHNIRTRSQPTIRFVFVFPITCHHEPTKWIRQGQKESFFFEFTLKQHFVWLKSCEQVQYRSVVFHFLFIQLVVWLLKLWALPISNLDSWVPCLLFFFCKNKSGLFCFFFFCFFFCIIVVVSMSKGFMGNWHWTATAARVCEWSPSRIIHNQLWLHLSHQETRWRAHDSRLFSFWQNKTQKRTRQQLVQKENPPQTTQLYHKNLLLDDLIGSARIEVQKFDENPGKQGMIGKGGKGINLHRKDEKGSLENVALTMIYFSGFPYETQTIKKRHKWEFERSLTLKHDQVWFGCFLCSPFFFLLFVCFVAFLFLFWALCGLWPKKKHWQKETLTKRKKTKMKKSTQRVQKIRCELRFQCLLWQQLRQ